MPQKILVADDEFDIRNLIKIILEKKLKSRSILNRGERNRG